MISINDGAGILFMGDAGPDMLLDVMELVYSYLQTENPDRHPDYLFVTIPEGKASIGVEEARIITQKAGLKASVADRIVIVIDHMDAMTEQAQNKLLKTLEDSQNAIIIGVAYNDTLLQTIKSRMRIVRYNSLSRHEFALNCDLPSEKCDIMYIATNGTPTLINRFENEIDMFQKMAEDCRNKPSNLLETLHLVKEKDELAVTENRQLMLACLRVMAYVYADMATTYSQEKNTKEAARCCNIAERLLKDTKRAINVNYKAANFFDTIVYVIEQK